MASDRDLARAAKARRRAQRQSLPPGRPGRAVASATRVPVQLERHDPVDDAQLSADGSAGSAPSGRPSLGTWTTPVLPDHFVTHDQLAAHQAEAQAMRAELAAVGDRIDGLLRR